MLQLFTLISSNGFDERRTKYMPLAFQQGISSVVEKDRVKKMALDKMHLRHNYKKCKCILFEM